METGLRWLLLVAVLKGVQCQSVKESGGRLVTPGTPLTLTCTVSGFSLSNYHMCWVRQAPGKGLEYIAFIKDSGTIYYSSWAKGRFTISKTSTTVDLKVTSPTIEDTATYFCARGLTGPSNGDPFDTWGPGTLVTVSSDLENTSPDLIPLPCPILGPGEPVVIVCLIRGFFPLGPLKVTWNVSGESVIFPPIPSPPSSLYTTYSLLRLPAEQCPEENSVACRVEHNNKGQDVTVPSPPACNESTIEPPTTPTCPCPCPSPSCGKPSLSLQRPDLGDLLLNSNASLTCTLRGLLNPEGAVFTWEPTFGKEPVQQSPQLDHCGCYSVSSVLPGCAVLWNAGTEFTCTVTHPEIEGGSLTGTISKDTGSLIPPQVHLLPPPSEELALNALVTLTCLVRGFSPKDVLVSWTHNGTPVVPKDSYLVWKPLPEPGQDPTTYAVTSLLRVPAEDWNQGDSYSCVVGHEGLAEHFTQKTIDRLAGKPTHVNVSVVVADVEGVCY